MFNVNIPKYSLIYRKSNLLIRLLMKVYIHLMSLIFKNDILI